MYPKQDAIRLGDYYIRHVQAMTSEALHSKADIAEQLAWRDRDIDTLTALNARLAAVLEQIDEKIGHFANAPLDPAYPAISVIGEVARLARYGACGIEGGDMKATPPPNSEKRNATAKSDEI